MSTSANKNSSHIGHILIGILVVLVGVAALAFGWVWIDPLGTETDRQNNEQAKEEAQKQESEDRFSDIEAGAANGEGEQLYYMALCYLEGQNVEADAVKGMDLMMRAADAGYAPAQMAMYQSLSTGTFVEEDRILAQAYLQMALDQNAPDALFTKAMLILEGNGYDDNEADPYALIQQAAQGGSAQAMWYLADCYATGNGMPQDQAKADEWTARADEQDAQDIAEREARMPKSLN